MGIAYAGDELYIYGTQLTNAMLTAFSLKNTTTTTSPVALRAYNATSTSSACWLTFTNYVHTAVFKGSYYLACGVPMRKITKGVARSLILDGPQAGIIHDGINVTIAESYGDDPSPKPPSSINSDDGTLGAGAVVGIIAGVVVMVGVLFTLLKSKNKKNTSSTMTNPQHAPLGGPLNPYFQKETFGPDRPNQFRYPLPTSVPTHALPMAPITPMPAPLMAAQPHTFQDQMQGLQFSSHPRPNFVTTGVAATGYGEGGLLPGAQTSVTGTAVWQPTPFVPPPSTRPSGAAPISTSVNTSGTTIATPSVVGSPQVPNTTRPQAPQFVEQHVDTGNGNRS
ncbi:hypothetical protein EC991_007771 [Linnemannia zychae]|nr:hypothetical protein EC991_007771 [Linnemannia zychae]